MVRPELVDRVRDHRQKAAAARDARSVRADRAHVAEHRVKAVVSDMAEPIDIIGEPRQPPGQRRSDHVYGGRSVDHRAHRGRQFVRVGDGGIGDEQEALDWCSPFARLQGKGFDVSTSHGWLLWVT